MEKRFDTIITHSQPHIDEIAAIWLLRKFGENDFPGISTAKVIFWDIGDKVLDGRSPAEYESEGALLVGVGGGRFDEHPIANSGRKQGECAATLVAKALRIEGEPSLEKILKFIATSDLKGVGHPFDLGYIVKLLHQQYPNDPEKVIEWAMMGLEAKYQEQLRFWSSTRQEFERIAEVEEIVGPGGRVLKMASFVSDNEQMNKFARSIHGGQAAIIIQQQSSGNVQIYTNRHFRLTLYDIAQMIRLAEQQAKGKVTTREWKKLAAEGKVEGVEEWFFHHAGQMLLNGSLTAKDVPPTRLSLEQIKEIVRIGINPHSFEPTRASYCKRGICRSTNKDPCPWYIWGLHRCRLIRFKMRKEKQR